MIETDDTNDKARCPQQCIWNVAHCDGVYVKFNFYPFRQTSVTIQTKKKISLPKTNFI